MNQFDIISMAKQCGLPLTYVPRDDTFSPHVDGLARFAALVSARAAKDEREACAKAMQPHLRDMISRGKAADLIRARGDQS